MSQTNSTAVYMLAKASKPLLALAAIVAVGQAVFLWRTPALRRRTAHGSPPVRIPSPWQDSFVRPDTDFSVFQRPKTGPAQNAGTLAQRFRLAGTFVEYGGVADTRKAVLDHRPSGKQTIASENETVFGVRIARIHPTSVILEDPELGQERIWLSFTGKPELQKGFGPVPLDATGGSAFFDTPEAFSIKQIGETSWIFQRETILEYYRELRDQPERLLNVFDSMPPVRDEHGVIQGYRLEVKGEADFFQAAGLRENDIVRSVNGRKLANRRIAEAFISDFIQDRANAFVLDIERDGTPKQFVYQVR